MYGHLYAGGHALPPGPDREAAVTFHRGALYTARRDSTLPVDGLPRYLGEDIGWGFFSVWVQHETPRARARLAHAMYQHDALRRWCGLRLAWARIRGQGAAEEVALMARAIEVYATTKYMNGIGLRSAAMTAAWDHIQERAEVGRIAGEIRARQVDASEWWAANKVRVDRIADALDLLPWVMAEGGA